MGFRRECLLPATIGFAPPSCGDGDDRTSESPLSTACCTAVTPGAQIHDLPLTEFSHRTEQQPVEQATKT